MDTTAIEKFLETIAQQLYEIKRELHELNDILRKKRHLPQELALLGF